MNVSHGYHLFMDGNAWCAVGPHFQSLAVSDAGFGSTKAAAVAALHDCMSKDRWWENKVLPPLSAFEVHETSVRCSAYEARDVS